MKNFNVKNRITITSFTSFTVSFTTKEPNTVVQIVNHLSSIKILGDNEKSSGLFIKPQKQTVSIYGDVVNLQIENETHSFSSVDIGSDVLEVIKVNDSGLRNFLITKAPALQKVYCYGNHLTAYTLNSVFRNLPSCPLDEDRYLFVQDGERGNPGIADCNIPLAINKGWKVMNKTGKKYFSENIINTSVLALKGEITEKNYHDGTTAVFEIVKDKNEIKKIKALEPNYIGYRYGQKYWKNRYDFDGVVFYGEEYDGEIVAPDIEAQEVGAIGYAFRLGDEAVTNTDGVWLEPPTDDYFVHVLDKDDERNGILCQEKGKELQSKTWTHDGYVYRYAKYWGNLRECRWTLNAKRLKEGRRAKAVLAKCKIENFEWRQTQ